MTVYPYCKASVFKLLVIAVLAAFLVSALAAQEANAGRALGAVTRIDAGSRQMTIRTDQGAEVQVTMDERATFRRIAPGETNLNNATAIAVTDIHPGDRVLARGKAGDTQGTLAAVQVIVMSQADIANKQANERADWDRRGATGVVTEAASDHVTISIRTLAGTQQMVITPAPDAIIRRYAPDSVRFADAKPSKLSEIKKGDQVRARGDKSPDNSKMTAEEIVSGDFRMIAGLIVSVDPQENVIRINNLQTKKQMTVKISGDSSLKKLQQPLAQLIANRLHGVADDAGGPGGRGGVPGGGPPGGFGPGPGAGAGPGGGTPGPQGRGGFPGGAGGRGEGPGGFGGRGGFGGGRGGDLQSMIDRTPTITVTDLKIGDAVIISSTVGANADQVTAITLLAGVEPILTRPGSREMSLGDWNMGGDLGGLGGFGQ
jgi:co-chaperonin GroES (HSP10)